MKEVRIGNDVHFDWRILVNDVPADLSTMDLKLEIFDIFGRRVPLSFTTQGSVLSADFAGSMQKNAGTYGLTLWVDNRQGGQYVEDACNCLKLVPKTCMIQGDVVGDISPAPAVIQLNSNLVIGTQGKSAYASWLSQGNQGTEADFLEWLRAPAKISAEGLIQLNQTLTDAENLRATAEQGRVASENMRIAAEQKRTDAETLRVNEEQKRTSAEVARESNESARKASESQRTTDESNRVSNEDSRKLAETNRSVAEQERTTAEGQRTAAESTRQTEESKRVSEENKRIDAESKRVISENNRVTEEGKRVTAETARQTNETARQTEYNSLKTQLQNTLSSGQTEVKALTATNDSVKSEEQKRVTAEASRANAEQERVSNENTRKASESSRTAEEQKRATAEGQRASAEQTRVTAEQKRVAAESARANVESARVTAEQARASAEQARVNEFNTLKTQSETATKNANDAATQANNYKGFVTEYNVSKHHPTAGIGGSNKFTLAEAIKLIPADLQSVGIKCSFLDDAGKMQLYVYQGGTFLDVVNWETVGSGERSTISTPKTYFSGNCYSIPYQAKYNPKNAVGGWFTLVWNNIEQSSNQFVLEWHTAYGDRFNITKRGTNTQLTLYLGGSMKWSVNAYLGTNETLLSDNWNALSVNLKTKEYLCYGNGVLTYSGIFNVGAEYDPNLIKDTYNTINFAKDSTNKKSLIGILNCKMDEQMAKEMYNEGLYYSTPVPSTTLAKGFTWDIDDYVKTSYSSVNHSVTGNTIRLTHDVASKSHYLRGKKAYNYLNRNIDISAKIKVVSGSIDFYGFFIYGSIHAKVYNAVTNSLIGDSNKGMVRLPVGEYHIIAENVIPNTDKDNYLMYYDVIEPSVIEITDIKTRLLGYALSCGANQIYNGMVRINEIDIVPCAAMAGDETVIFQTKVGTSTNVKSEFAGQHLIVGDGVYIAAKGGQIAWKKINNV